MNALLPDIRFALRLMLKAPGFTLTAVLSLALGIGANVTVYTWMRQMVLDPLPGVTQSGQLIAMETRDSEGNRSGISYPEYKDLRDENRVLQGSFAGQQVSRSMQDRGPTQRILVWFSNWNMFDVLGVKPQVGRLFQPEDDRPGSALSVVLSHRFWKQHCGGDPSIIGRNLRMGNETYRVLGVTPEGFFGPVGGLNLDVFVPLEPFIHRGGDGESNLENRQSRSFYVMGRPKAELSAAAVKAGLANLFKELEARHPKTHRDIRLMVFPVSEAPMGAPVLLKKPMALLLVAVTFILLITCANIANLLLAKASGRQREMALRSALGASRARLSTQMLTESIVLGLLGGLGGLLLSTWSLGLLVSRIPTNTLNVAFQVQLDYKALIFALLLSLITAIVFGLVPALRATKRDTAETLKQGGNRGSGLHQRLQAVLVVMEIAIAVALLVGAGLMVKSSHEIQKDHPGFEPKGVLYGKLGLELGNYDVQRAAQFAQLLREKVAALPQVESVSFSEGQPMSFGGPKGVGLRVEGVDVASTNTTTCARNLVGPDFFHVFRIPIIAGRDISVSDEKGSEPIVVVNQAFVDRYLKDGEALGKRIEINGKWRKVVGVSRNFKFETWTDKPKPFVYIPLTQGDIKAWNLVVRTRGPVSSLIQPLRSLIANQDSTLPVVLEDMEDVTENSGIVIRLAGRALAQLGIIALLLASMGIYSVMAYSVAQRKTEIGIRMAMGATSSDILGMVLKQGSILIGTGLGLGLLGAFTLGNRFADVLYRTSPKDPLVFITVPLLLCTVAILACALPAWRASRLDPLKTLKAD